MVSAKPSSPTTVLIIEDEALVALDLERELARRGFDVCGIAATRRQALAIVERNPPEVAIVDVHLAAGDDGVELGSELTSVYGVTVLYATGNADEVRRRAEAGLLVVLEKPYTPDAVIAAIYSAQRLALPRF